MAIAAFRRGARPYPLVYGHRGTRRGAPENTLAAMQLAIDQGADGVELDVRLCKSGEVIVLHDPDLARVAKVALRAQDATLAELQSHDLGAGQRVPTLDAAIDLVVLGAERLLNIELKSDVPDSAALVSAVTARVAARTPDERARVLFSSFSASICRLLAAALPSIPVAYLYEEPSAAALPVGCGAVNPRFDLITPAQISCWHAQELVVNTWTVNDATQATTLAVAGVDGIITDDVPLVLQALAVR
jgi:glycerophosphoryl diester phosphodiesterase